MISSSAPGMSWTMKPPAALTVQSVSTSTPSAHADDLLALEQIRRQILCDLAADKLDRTDIWLSHADVAADGEHTVASDSGADLSLPSLRSGSSVAGLPT